MLTDPSPEMIVPWHSIDVQYDEFQVAMWQNEISEQALAVEIEMGPYNGTMHYEILLLPKEFEQNMSVIAKIADGIPTATQAVQQAVALMMNNTVEDHV